MLQRRLQRSVHLVLDFDGTFTARDTLALLACTTHKRDVRTGRLRALSQRPSAQQPFDPGPQWMSFVQAYTADYDQFQRTHPSLDNTCSAPQLSAWLASLEQVERSSLDRVQTANFFRHVTVDDIQQTVEEAAQYDLFDARVGWYDLFDLFVPRSRLDKQQRELVEQSTISILSVNWSATFVRLMVAAALAKHVRLERDGVTDHEMFDLIHRRMRVVANELDTLHSVSGSSGRIVGAVHTNIDKLRHLPPARVKQNIHHPERRPNGSMPFLVYVGDSSTDFDCLLAADVGVWLHPLAGVAREEFTKAFEARFHQVNVNPIDIQNGSPTAAASDTVMWASKLDEIATFITRLDGGNV